MKKELNEKQEALRDAKGLDELPTKAEILEEQLNGEENSSTEEGRL